MRAAKIQASLRIRAVSPEPSLLAHTSSESRGTFRQKARSLAPLNGWACAVTICHDGMLEDTNSLDGAHITNNTLPNSKCTIHPKIHVVLVLVLCRVGLRRVFQERVIRPLTEPDIRDNTPGVIQYEEEKYGE